MYNHLMSLMTNSATVADTDVFAQVGRGDPAILYNITGYGLSVLFFNRARCVRSQNDVGL